MVRIAFVADVHLGNHRRLGGPSVASLNRRCREGLAVLRRAVELAHERRCQRLVVLGDLVDMARPLAQLLAEIQDIAYAANDRQLGLIVIGGNHCRTSAELGDHALGPLRTGMEVYADRPVSVLVEDVTLVLVPFRPGPAGEWFSGAVAGPWDLFGGRVRGQAILGFHLGISDAQTAPFLRGADDSVPVGLIEQLMDRHGFDAAVAGNWHEYRQWETPDRRPIVQVSALVPTGWDNPGATPYGWMSIWDSERRSFDGVQVPGPRFFRLSLEEAQSFRPLSADHQAYVELRVQPAAVQQARELLDDLVADGVVVAGSVTLEAETATQQVRSSARSVRGPDSLEDALVDYSIGLTVPPGVEVGRVMGRVRQYLQQGGGDG